MESFSQAEVCFLADDEYKNEYRKLVNSRLICVAESRCYACRWREDLYLKCTDIALWITRGKQRKLTCVDIRHLSLLPKKQTATFAQMPACCHVSSVCDVHIQAVIL